LSLITNAYITGSNSVGSKVSVSLLSDSYFENATATYQWYRSSVYDGYYEEIIGATSKDYVITINDRYLKCFVQGTGNFSESSMFTNILVVNQLQIDNNTDNISTRTRLANIGNGLSLDNVVSQVSGSSVVVSDVSRINQSIKLILSTARGEVPMIPNFGTDLPRMLYDGVDDNLVDMMKLEIESSLLEQEPRIDLISVDEEYDEDHTVSFAVNYKIKNTNIQSTYIYKPNSGGDVYE